jgi:hypothetical protein
MPLCGLEDSKRIWADRLVDVDRNRKFICPICKDDFILVIPDHRITHFRHRNKEDHWEPETPEHLEMKLYVQKMCGFFNIPCELEAPIEFSEEVELIPDALLKWQKAKIALECQCSIVSLEDWIRKTREYLLRDYVPIWILAGQYFERWMNGNSLVFDRRGVIESAIEATQGTTLSYPGNCKLQFSRWKQARRRSTMGWFNWKGTTLTDALRNCIHFQANAKGRTILAMSNPTSAVNEGSGWRCTFCGSIYHEDLSDYNLYNDPIDMAQNCCRYEKGMLCEVAEKDSEKNE